MTYAEFLNKVFKRKIAPGIFGTSDAPCDISNVPYLYPSGGVMDMGDMYFVLDTMSEICEWEKADA